MNEENASEEERWEILRELGFLRGIGDDHVKSIASLGKVVDFPEGTVIFGECEPATHCYLIVDGSVLLEIGGPAGRKQILTVGKGELLGWSTLLGAAQLTATARTLTGTRAIELSGHHILDLCEQFPDFGYQFMRCTARALAKRLTATRLQLLDLYATETRAFGWTPASCRRISWSRLHGPVPIRS
jgi:CRP-like cAMP-binding protein